MKTMPRSELEKLQKQEDANAKRQSELAAVKQKREKTFRLNEKVKLNRE